VPVKVVSERLGHATPTFTIDTDQHVLPGMQADAACGLRTTHRPAGSTGRWFYRFGPVEAPEEDGLKMVEALVSTMADQG
jgi:hypothetical protein